MFEFETVKDFSAAVGKRGSMTIPQAEKQGSKKILGYCPGKRLWQTNRKRE